MSKKVEIAINVDGVYSINPIVKSLVMKFFALFCAVLLIIALAPMPAEYYTFLRIPVTIAAVFIIFKEMKSGLNIWSAAFFITAVIFNPIHPIYLYDKLIWLPIDILGAFLFLLYAVSKDEI